MRFLCTIAFLFGTFISDYAQTIINNYAKVTDIPACNPCLGNCNTIVVDDASVFNVGDRVMLFQIKSAQVDLTSDPTFGDIIDYGAAFF